MRQLIAGNWKMNGLGQTAMVEIEALRAGLAAQPAHADVLVCPPATLIARAHWMAKGAFPFGGQDCHAQASGAFTGDISAEMLKDAGASWVIVGHSERRQYHHESDADVAAKATAAWRAGLTAIICIGESETERADGHALDVVSRQLEGSVPEGFSHQNTVIAYEPIWAIGTGKTPTSEEILEMHAHIRKHVGGGVRVLYGGSVKPANAKEILSLANVDGALVGGACLKAEDFLAVIAAAAERS